MNCYCGSNLIYEKCCQPYIYGDQYPETAEQLMRSRYAAYATYNAAYLEETMAGPAREKAAGKIPPHSWVELKILSTTQGTANDESGAVEFKASFEDDGMIYTMHELSQFEKINHRWFYIDGKQLYDNHGSENCQCCH